MREKVYWGRDVSPEFIFLDRLGWCQIRRYSKDTAKILGFSFGVYRLGWGNTFIPWDILSKEEKRQLWSHYRARLTGKGI